MLTNHKPIVRGSDEGIWRRLRLVPLPRRHPRTRTRRALRPAPRREIDAVLTWLVNGHRDWHQHGLGTSWIIEGTALASETGARSMNHAPSSKACAWHDTVRGVGTA
jgi:putative DNA primase/helicase